MSKDAGGRNSSFREKPVRPRPRRLVEWINLMGAKEVPFNSFFGISDVLILRESCMRENRTCSLRGGRRLACKRASSDPTIQTGSGRSVPGSRLVFTSPSLTRSAFSGTDSQNLLDR
jgi:hypothetical protein